MGIRIFRKFSEGIVLLEILLTMIISVGLLTSYLYYLKIESRENLVSRMEKELEIIGLAAISFHNAFNTWPKELSPSGNNLQNLRFLPLEWNKKNPFNVDYYIQTNNKNYLEVGTYLSKSNLAIALILQNRLPFGSLETISSGCPSPLKSPCYRISYPIPVPDNQRLDFPQIDRASMLQSTLETAKTYMSQEAVNSLQGNNNDFFLEAQACPPGYKPFYYSGLSYGVGQNIIKFYYSSSEERFLVHAKYPYGLNNEIVPTSPNPDWIMIDPFSVISGEFIPSLPDDKMSSLAQHGPSNIWQNVFRDPNIFGQSITDQLGKDFSSLVVAGCRPIQESKN